MILTAILLPLTMQAVPDPSNMTVPDYSAEVQDRPPRESTIVDAPETSGWLGECLAQLDEDPARAHVQAQIRRDTTSGEERVLANHCLGLASTRLERWEEARAAFTAALQETPAEDRRLRARFGAMAGNAALVTGDLGGALALLDGARDDAAASGAGTMQALIALDRARALVGSGQLEAAEAALAEARNLQPEDAETRLLSATLLRRLDRLPEAQSQIEEAARLAPLDPAIGLEAGVIAILSAREEAARASWQSVIELAPDSDEAATAQRYLDQLGPAPESAPQP
ncbi:tetratricopeptide repeat protein [Altererythrobacter sp. BO-6]|uniref:tetratricopeptide repeat protein n=1 Tax=Altererythrobacter sp. BO-6 TaxID=2604537 RepID=UPI0013E138B1|nr:tetratricopeptide repeat protein [Altererythrobacter sp. BO-6]QIG54114.1 tetratricopeptide repeat protein [Altererythrobacter sp. BO-6]